MDQSNTFLRIFGSSLAGAVGFAVGFYAGFFLALSIWGLEAPGAAFAALGVLGGLAAGGAIALTVKSGRKAPSVILASTLGALLALTIFIVDADAGAMAIGGLVVSVVTAALIRTGSLDSVFG